MSQSENLEGPGDGAFSEMSHDDSARRFRRNHPDDRFSGSSGLLFEQAMAQTRMAICLTDPYGDDNPIVFANRAFRNLTGYEEAEIVGRNCRFLQGPDTDQRVVRRLGEAIKREDVTIVELLNYRKDGTAFWNALHVGPIYDDSGRLVYLFGSQWDVSDLHVARAQEQQSRLIARELSHRMKNMFSVISAIVNVTGRVRGIEAETGEIASRIQALGRAYDTTLDGAAAGTSDLGDAIAATLAPYGDRIDFKGEQVQVAFGIVSALGLILHELAANATKYGAWTKPGGHVELDWRRSADSVELHWTEKGGPPLDGSAPKAGTGTVITDRLLRSAGGCIERRWESSGLVATVTLPMRAGGDG